MVLFSPKHRSKKISMKKIFYLTFGLLVLIFGCKTEYISIPITYAPLVPLPQHYKIAVYNASWTDTTKKSETNIESIVTGEALAGDKQGSEACVMAFKNAFNNYENIVVILPAQHVLMQHDPTKTQSTMDWNLVKSLCRKNQTDAIAVLEQFDTNSDAFVGSIMTGINLLGHGGLPQPQSINFSINYYWRLYDTLSQTIKDQYGDVLQQQCGALTPLGGLPKEAITSAANWIGNNYASRFIAPTYWEERNYYKKANDDFKVAMRKANVNDWTGAMQIWSKYTGNSNKKIAGRANYNMAVGSEVNGNLQDAHTFAQKAYTDYGLKRARDYDYIIQGRLPVQTN